MEDELDVVCIVDCPDCEVTVITDPDLVSMFAGFGEITAITICGYCERPVSCSIEKDFAEELAAFGVRIFSWETGSEIGVAEVQ